MEQFKDFVNEAKNDIYPPDLLKVIKSDIIKYMKSIGNRMGNQDVRISTNRWNDFLKADRTAYQSDDGSQFFLDVNIHSLDDEDSEEENAVKYWSGINVSYGGTKVQSEFQHKDINKNFPKKVVNLIKEAVKKNKKILGNK